MKQNRHILTWITPKIFVSSLIIILFGCTPSASILVSKEVRSPSSFVPIALQIPEETLQKQTPPLFMAKTLKNGLRVSLWATPENTTVAIHIAYHAATAHQPANSPELAHLLEHMIIRAPSLKNPHQAITTELTDFGGFVNGSTEAELTNYRTQVPKEQLQRALEIGAQSMTQANLTNDIFLKQQKSVQKESQARLSSSPVIPVILNALSRLLNGHPYGNYFSTTQDWTKISLEQVITFYQNFYQPKNAQLTVVGPIDLEQTLTQIEQLFGSIPNRNDLTPPQIPSLFTWTYPKMVEVFQSELPIQAAIQAYPLPSQKNQDYAALWVLSHMWCPNHWQNGVCLSDENPFFTELVKKQHSALVAGIGFAQNEDGGQTNTSLGVAPFQAGGTLYLYAVYLPYRRQKTAFSLIEQEKKRLTKLDWLTEESLRRSKRRIIKDIYKENYSPLDQADALSKMKHLQGDERYAFHRIPSIELVTRDDVKRVFHQYILEQSPVSLYIIPRKVPPLIRLFGWLYPIAYRFIKHPLIPEE